MRLAMRRFTRDTTVNVRDVAGHTVRVAFYVTPCLVSSATRNFSGEFTELLEDLVRISQAPDAERRWNSSDLLSILQRPSTSAVLRCQS